VVLSAEEWRGMMIALVVDCANRLAGGALSEGERRLMVEDGEAGARKVFESCGLAAVAWARDVLTGIEHGLLDVL